MQGNTILLNALKYLWLLLMVAAYVPGPTHGPSKKEKYSYSISPASSSSLATRPSNVTYCVLIIDCYAKFGLTVTFILFVLV
eukprot:snap_masked-scaffold_15-processed-gene-3.14-mRNA-1 protein AED:1.00 eAED:1.00 QI:0/0/0/0/1/1/3/0/81